MSMFLASVKGQRERYAFLGGRLLMMAGGSEDRNDIQVNLLAALKRRLRGDTGVALRVSGKREQIGCG